MGEFVAIKEKTVYLAGHNGMVGSAVLRRLSSIGHSKILTPPKEQLDLTNQSQVNDYFSSNSIDLVILAAARVGGISANAENPAEFIYDNLMIQSNVIHAANENNIDELLFLGSSCIYPKFCEQPIQEKELLNGYLEPTNEPYALAKIAGIKMCESYSKQYNRNYRSIMPTNLYGPNDNFHLKNSHVLPALLHRFHNAKESQEDKVEIWGTGSPRREFLHVDDLASACLFVADLPKGAENGYGRYSNSHINIGTGQDISIADLAKKISEVVGYEGEITFDPQMPDGTPRKLLDVSRMDDLGWKYSIGLDEGISQTYDWFKKNYKKLRLK